MKFASLSNKELRSRLDFSDQELLKECEVHPYRSSGPGGQKKNKTYSAVRINHVPTGLTFVGTESRSQPENKARALKRLRQALAIQYRIPLPDGEIWPENIRIINRRLAVNSKNPMVYQAIALVLDALADHRGKLREASQSLGITSSSMVKFLAQYPKAWQEANRYRRQSNLPPLKP